MGMVLEWKARKGMGALWCCETTWSHGTAAKDPDRAPTQTCLANAKTEGASEPDWLPHGIRMSASASASCCHECTGYFEGKGHLQAKRKCLERRNTSQQGAF